MKLTPREEKALALIVQGLSNKQIAERLNISVNRLKKIIDRLYIKIGVSGLNNPRVRARRLFKYITDGYTLT